MRQGIILYLQHALVPRFYINFRGCGQKVNHCTTHIFNPENSKFMKTYLILFFWILILLPACNEKTKYVQPELGSRALELLEVDGFQFKD